METTTEKTLLKDYSDQEKGAYLGAIASIATVDHVASPAEIEYLETLGESAGISPAQKAAVAKAATELSDNELKRCLDILKESELRFSLVADLIHLAEIDQQYSVDEKQSVENIASYLGVNHEQFSLLDQFVKKSAAVDAQPEEVKQPGFLASLGLQDKFKQAGINWKRFLPGLLGIAGPLVLSRLLGRNRSTGLTNTGGGMFGGNSGIGSLTSMLNGGRGLGNIGGLLSGLLRRR